MGKRSQQVPEPKGDDEQAAALLPMIQAQLQRLTSESALYSDLLNRQQSIEQFLNE